MNCCEHLRKAIDSQQPIKQVEWTLEQKTGDSRRALDGEAGFSVDTK